MCSFILGDSPTERPERQCAECPDNLFSTPSCPSDVSGSSFQQALGASRSNDDTPGENAARSDDVGVSERKYRRFYCYYKQASTAGSRPLPDHRCMHLIYTIIEYCLWMFAIPSANDSNGIFSTFAHAPHYLAALS